MDTTQLKELCKRYIKKADKVYNLTICPNPKHFDCIDCWNIKEDIRQICMMSLKSTKDVEVAGVRIMGAYEPFPHNRVRGHLHCQMYLDVYGKDSDIRVIINKFHGMLNKLIGNSKIEVNIPYEVLMIEKSKRGIDTSNVEYKEYYDYMYKQVICHQDLFEMHIDRNWS